MGFFSYLVIAFGLTADAAAVSIASSLNLQVASFKQAFKIASVFAFFHWAMMLVGGFFGNHFARWINGFDHWLAFALLIAIGGKMIHEAHQKIEGEKIAKMKLVTLFILALATSIDVVVVGLSFSLLKQPVMYPAVLTGIVAFIVSFFGVLLGRRLGVLWEDKIRFIGGIILILIGSKILFDHLM